MPAEVGQPAPELAIPDYDRQIRRLTDHPGQTIVLAFFPGAFTGVCTTEMCQFRDRLQAFNDLNAQVYGISVDGPFAQKKWAEDNNLNFPLLSDHNRQATNAYGVALPNLAGLEGYTAAQRAVFIIDPQGTIRYKWVAESPLNEPDYDEVQRQTQALAP